LPPIEDFQMKRRSSALEISIDPQDGDLCIEQTGMQCEAKLFVPVDQIDWLCEQLQAVSAESERRSHEKKNNP
jgi:hypothetical protein